MPLGEGIVDFVSLRDLLVTTGFDGWVNVELDGGRGLDPAVVAERARSYVTGTLGLPLAHPDGTQPQASQERS